MPEPKRRYELRQREVGQSRLRGWVFSDDSIEITLRGQLMHLSVGAAKALRSMLGEYFTTVGEGTDA